MRLSMTFSTKEKILSETRISEQLTEYVQINRSLTIDNNLDPNLTKVKDFHW